MSHVRSLLLLACALLAGCTASEATGPVAQGVNPTAAGDEDVRMEAVAKNSLSDQGRAKPLRYTVRKAVAADAEPVIPPVLLSAGHQKMCRLNVGDSFPALHLPGMDGSATDWAALCGKQATIVLFWHPDRWMARTALIDMQRDIASQLNPKQVAVVGVAVLQPRGAVQASLNKAQAVFPQLLDTDGQAFAQVGTSALPRLYVLDPAGKIVWFDIEYSEGTRRELWQTLRVMTK